MTLEHADGAPRLLPAPWTDLQSPPLDSADPGGVEDDRFSLPIAMIAGTSIGALIGAGWANGMTGKELREHSLSVLGTLRIIAARLWGNQVRNLGGLLQNGLNFQLDPNRVVDAFLPDVFPDHFEELQIPLGTVKTRTLAAMRKLRRALYRED